MIVRLAYLNRGESMREIKFRAWDKKRKRSVEVIAIHFYYEEIVTKDIVIFFEDCILMQYTGLKDKNGVEIYEGDILLGHCVYPECNIFESKLIGEVYYSSRGTWDCYSYILGGFNEQVEVIGNIHEHNHLLEQNKNK